MGYTSSGDNPSSAMENTSGVSGMAATIGKGNFSSTEISSMASDLRASSTSSSSLAANVYEHENWGGASQGIYGSTADLGRDWDNTISSLIIYPNWCITLYENSHYSGHWRRLCARSGMTVRPPSRVRRAVDPGGGFCSHLHELTRERASLYFCIRRRLRGTHAWCTARIRQGLCIVAEGSGGTRWPARSLRQPALYSDVYFLS